GQLVLDVVDVRVVVREVQVAVVDDRSQLYEMVRRVAEDDAAGRLGKQHHRRQVRDEQGESARDDGSGRADRHWRTARETITPRSRVSGTPNAAAGFHVGTRSRTRTGPPSAASAAARSSGSANENASVVPVTVTVPSG